MEAIESDGNLDASDSESDIGEAEKEMKKYIKVLNNKMYFLVVVRNEFWQYL